MVYLLRSAGDVGRAPRRRRADPRRADRYRGVLRRVHELELHHGRHRQHQRLAWHPDDFLDPGLETCRLVWTGSLAIAAARHTLAARRDRGADRPATRAAAPDRYMISIPHT